MYSNVLKPTAGIYIDGANIYHGGKDTGWHIDYAKLNDIDIHPQYDYHKSIDFTALRGGFFVLEQIK